MSERAPVIVDDDLIVVIVALVQRQAACSLAPNPARQPGSWREGGMGNGGLQVRISHPSRPFRDPACVCSAREGWKKAPLPPTLSEHTHFMTHISQQVCAGNGIFQVSQSPAAAACWGPCVRMVCASRGMGRAGDEA
jgi:hypothetical protein